VVLLGEVGELEVEAERPQHLGLPLRCELPDRLAQLVTRSALAGGPGEPADALLGREQVGALLLDEDASEDVAEQADVPAKRSFRVDPRDPRRRALPGRRGRTSSAGGAAAP
jgi:hypothetical protein